MGYNPSQGANQAQHPNNISDDINFIIDNSLAVEDDLPIGHSLAHRSNQFHAANQSQVKLQRQYVAPRNLLNSSPLTLGYSPPEFLQPSIIAQSGNQFQAVSQDQHQSRPSDEQRGPLVAKGNTIPDNATLPSFDQTRGSPRIEESVLSPVNDTFSTIDHFLAMNQCPSQTEPGDVPSSWAQTLSYVDDISLEFSELVEGARRNNNAGPRSKAESAWQKSSLGDGNNTIAMSIGTSPPRSWNHEVENLTPSKLKGTSLSQLPIVGRFSPYKTANQPAPKLPCSQAATTAASSSQIFSNPLEPALSSFTGNQATSYYPTPSRPIVIPMETSSQPLTDTAPTACLPLLHPKPKRLTRPKRKNYARWTTDLNIYRASKLLDKRAVIKDGKKENEYLVRWATSKNYEHGDDSWTPENWVEVGLVEGYESQSALGLC
ncbi:hypothetical protein BGZ60DRAFT_416711 [Tricladium varicosporioides]|nr:hypothetical protein BGZ60DRAFT_416711 [Hymenoscyphus varicosporioides]